MNNFRKATVGVVMIIISSVYFTGGCASTRIAGDPGREPVEGSGGTGGTLPAIDTDAGTATKTAPARDGTESPVGTFKLMVTGYEGVLVIAYERSTDSYSGTIRFTGWGKGIPEPLRDLRINNEKIFFIRAISSTEEMSRYGSSRLFSQRFSGIFSADYKTISGSYVDSGTEFRWRAVRVQGR